MTEQVPDKLINNCPGVSFGELRPFQVVLGDPAKSGDWEGYGFISLPNPRLKCVTTACWQGYISVYVLDRSGQLSLDRFEYSSRGASVEIVDEPLEGDFWLLMSGLDSAETVCIPFIDGEIVRDRGQWVTLNNFDQELEELGVGEGGGVDRPSKGACLVVLSSLLVIFSLLYVPFDAFYVYGSSNLRGYAGYSLIWSPPQPVEVCKEVFDVHVGVSSAARRCSSRPIYLQVALTTFASIVLLCSVAYLVHRVRPGNNGGKEFG